jgi:hypothetical protein
MAKREYIQANKEWLEAKAKEEGVKALSLACRLCDLIEGWIIQPFYCDYGKQISVGKRF